MKLLKAVEKVKPDLEAIQPEKDADRSCERRYRRTGKGTEGGSNQRCGSGTESARAEGRKSAASAENPSTKEKLKEAQERQRLENQNRKLLVQVECLEQELEQERSFSDRLLDGVSAVMDFLDRHLPEKFRPLVERGPGSCCLCRRCTARAGAGTRSYLGRHGALIR